MLRDRPKTTYFGHIFFFINASYQKAKYGPVDWNALVTTACLHACPSGHRHLQTRKISWKIGIGKWMSL